MTKQEILSAQAQHVVMKNELIQNSRYNLGLLEQRALLYLISKIKPTDKPYTEYPFSIDEFNKVCKHTERTGRYTEYAHNVLKSLNTKQVEIQLDEHRRLITNWINEAVINDETGVVSITFSKYLTPYLYELRQFYTSFCLEEVLAMNSKYGIRLFEYIKSIKSKGWKQAVPLEELRIRMDCVEKYTEYKDFRKFALEPAVKDINTYTNIKISYEAIKVKKWVKAIEFTILDVSNAEELTARQIAKAEAIQPD